MKMKDLYTEMCNTLMEQTGEDTRRQRYCLYSQMERTNTVKMADLPKAVYTFITMFTLAQFKKKPESILHSHRKSQSQNMLEAVKTRIFEETLNKENTMTLPPYIISNDATEPQQ